MALRSTSLSSPIVPNCLRSSSGYGTDDCGRTSGPSRPSTMPSPPSTRPSGARGRRSFVFVREDGEAATEQPSPQRRLASPARGARGYPRRALTDNNDTTAIALAVLGPRAVEIDEPGSDCVAQAAEQMVQEQRLGVRRFRVPHVGVPRAPAIEIVVPAHGVMSAVRTALVARFIDLDEHGDGRIDRKPILLSELLYCGDAVGDRAVTKSRRLGEDEHARLLRVCRDGDRDRGEERERDDESGHGTRERWETTATGVRQSAAPFGMWVPLSTPVLA